MNDYLKLASQGSAPENRAMASHDSNLVRLRAADGVWLVNRRQLAAIAYRSAV